MQKKWILVTLLAAILMTSQTACGRDRSPAEPTEPVTTVQETTGEEKPNWQKEAEDAPWKAALAEDLFQKYGVLPEYYEDLGDGIYQVYVEVGGEIVPFVTVNSATGEYHG